MPQPTTVRGRKPRVLLLPDLHFDGVPLSSIVADAGCEAVAPPADAPLGVALDEVPPPLDLVVTSLSSRTSKTLEAVTEFRKRDWMATVPILGVGCVSGAELDLWQLRALGIAGLIDRGAPAEHVRFRIGQAAYKGREGRRFERAACCIPVEVEVGGERRSAFATSLSIGGMGLACAAPIEPNTRVTLRFALDEDDRVISVCGRTVHVRESRRTDARYHIGIFFLDVSAPIHGEIALAVARLLAAWDVIEARSLAPGSTSG